MKYSSSYNLYKPPQAIAWVSVTGFVPQGRWEASRLNPARLACPSPAATKRSSNEFAALYKVGIRKI